MTTTVGPNPAPRVTGETLERLAHLSAAPDGRPRIDVVSPFTEEIVGRVPAATEADVAAAAERARAAQMGWAGVPVTEKVRILSRFHDLLIDRSAIAMDIVQLEVGKARIPAFEEVFSMAATIRYFMNTGPGLLKRRRRAVSMPGLTTTYEYRHPRGVVGNISPWNFPLTLAIGDIIPALLAGNTVITKPDEKSSLSTLYGASLLAEAGLPDGVLQVVTGIGEEVGPPLVDEVDFIMFTGSTEVGRLVSGQAGGRLIASSLELGGKNAAVVLADADLDRTIPGISRAVFANGGQLCVGMERIYVDEAIREEFTRRFVEHTRNLPMTRSFDFSSTMSSMISREHMDKVHSHVEDAVAKGATLLTGGKPCPEVGPLFYEPTILTNVVDTMQLCRSETFGPVVSIYGYDDIDQAVAAANDSDYGLNFSVWTRDTRRGVGVASRLEAGTVGINDGYAAVWSSFDSPLGGMKSSGVGRRHGAEGLLKYTEPQTVSVQRIWPAFAPMGDMSYEGYQRLMGVFLKLAKRLPFYK